ncbi:hypothetical protein SAMN06265218_1036 [Fodinibius sediminis]|uniref:Uncharacterized protein n=1 Tax=Fodinibius sediminis TaxID=1214077 RepID=A0A521BDJ5_9BACT|nr:hypothetical protein SAMN06265218_1036 [Fodinibius sediminis]
MHPPPLPLYQEGMGVGDTGRAFLLGERGQQQWPDRFDTISWKRQTA